ncbi:MAG TPA: hypothetical protein PKC58_17810, partial [Ignavibacteria bacterium]|nr:hypothetical protein [Ignavibacteria bacterium]
QLLDFRPHPRPFSRREKGVKKIFLAKSPLPLGEDWERALTEKKVSSQIENVLATGAELNIPVLLILPEN